MTHSRFDKLNASLRTSDLDAVILNPGPTLTHLTGSQYSLAESAARHALDQDARLTEREVVARRGRETVQGG